MAAAIVPLTAAGWRAYFVAVTVLVMAVAVIFAFSASSPVTVRLFFSASDSFPSSSSSSATDLKIIIPANANEVNSTTYELAAPPLDSEDISIYAENSDDDEIPINTTLIYPPPPSLIRSSEDDGEKTNGGFLEIPSLKSEAPLVSTFTVSPPLIDSSTSTGLSSTSEPANNSKSDEEKSDSGSPKVPPILSEVITSSIQESVTLTETERQLMYAKEQIDHAPLISDVSDLHPSLFRNVSVFKRSYELMGRILKVYVYRDGKRPIFHTPVLKGIYASEGWFMKLMEANSKFVVKNPNKAHLFYLPYSARQLEETLYKPNSHKLRPLAIFLKNYVDQISAKYPFWNQTKGADHFLVACHDWGPYTTRLHEELNKNTIKALCNADLSEGFIKGKDVSLPETLIINPRRPLRDLGGKPVSERSILAFFAGNMHGRVRPILLEYWSGKDEDMKIYGPLPRQVARKMSYSQHMKSSKFCICPMGYEVNSPRIVEAIYYECVPVIIADNFVLPFDEVLDWNGFSVVVAEKDIPNLKDILLKIPFSKYVSMHENVKRLQRHFLWHAKPEKYDIFHMILHSVWFHRLNQISAF